MLVRDGEALFLLRARCSTRWYEIAQLSCTSDKDTVHDHDVTLGASFGRAFPSSGEREGLEGEDSDSINACMER